MPEIVVAIPSPRDWNDFRTGVHQQDREFDLQVRGATWRTSGEVWPSIQPQERVWLCWGTIVRGHAPLLRFRYPTISNQGAVVLDLRDFRPETVTFRFGDDFTRSWRYLVLRPWTQKVPFWNWEHSGFSQRRQQMQSFAERMQAASMERIS